MELFHKKNLVYLRKRKGFSQEQLAAELGYSRSAYKEYEYQREPDLVFLCKASLYFHVSIDDFLRRDLEERDKQALRNRLLSMEDGRVKVLAITVDEQQKENIELVPVKAKAGYLDGFADPEFISGLKRLHLPIAASGTYRAFEIQGDSMPPIREGAIVVGRYVDNWSEVRSLRTYIVVTRDEGIVYKRLQNKLHDKGYFALLSDNPLYDTYTKTPEEILELWEYHCHISFEPGDEPFHADESLLGKLDELSTQVGELGRLLKGREEVLA